MFIFRVSALIISCTKWNELRKNTDDSKNDLKQLYVLYLLQVRLYRLYLLQVQENQNTRRLVRIM